MSTSVKNIISLAILNNLIEINHENLLLKYDDLIRQKIELPAIASGSESRTQDILCNVLHYLIAKADDTGPIDMPDVEDAPEPGLPAGVERWKIVRVERRESRNNKRPQWELTAIDGRRIWLTHFTDDDEKDAYKFLLASGYATYFDKMAVGEVQRWQWTPITVDVKQNGDFWNIVNIVPHFTDEPDTAFSFMPERKKDIIEQAKKIEGGIVIDFETTGLRSEDQLVQIGAVNTKTGEMMNDYVQPTVSVNPAARDIHNISEETLAEAHQFPHYAKKFFQLLDSDTTLIGFNIQFDLRILKQTLEAHDMPEYVAKLQEIQSNATIIDVKPMVETFIGDPYSGDAPYRYQSLQNAASYLGIEQAFPHRADQDARTTWAIIETLKNHELDPLDEEEPVSDYMVLS